MVKKISHLDHYSIGVTNIQKSIFFYNEILGLKIVDRPSFDFDGAWLDCGNNIRLHLIVVDNDIINIPTGTRLLHFAFVVDDIYEFKNYLESQDITIIKDIKPRPDGILQLYVKDPDGYYIELTQMK